jgi:hypothetical protein
MRAGTENRARKLWLFAPKTPDKSTANTPSEP